MNIRCEKCGDVYVKTLERGWETTISGLCSKHTFQEQQEETKLRIERDELRVKLREAEQKAGAAKVAAKAWEDDYNIAKRALEVLQKDFAMTRNLQQENHDLRTAYAAGAQTIKEERDARGVLVKELQDIRATLERYGHTSTIAGLDGTSGLQHAISCLTKDVEHWKGRCMNAVANMNKMETLQNHLECRLKELVAVFCDKTFKKE